MSISHSVSSTLPDFTRSRSNSISSLLSIKEEEILPEKKMDLTEDKYVSQPTNNPSSIDNITTMMLTRGLQATIDATNNSEKMKEDIRNLYEITSLIKEGILSIEKRSRRMEEQSIRAESRLIRMEEKIDAIFRRNESTASMDSDEPIETVPTAKQDNAMGIIISSWIRTSLANQKRTTGTEWNLDLNFKHQDNVAVTNGVIDYVASQITATTNIVHWVNLISYKDLHNKICLVFRRHRTKKFMAADRHAAIKKHNIRKSRRVTKSLHRKQVLSHQVYGKTMRDLFGDGVEDLAIEQLQSDEESTDTEMGETTKKGILSVITPSWRSKKGIEAFKKFDELDLLLRPNSTKERALRTPGRLKDVDVKEGFLERAPLWSRV